MTGQNRQEPSGQERLNSGLRAPVVFLRRICCISSRLHSSSPVRRNILFGENHLTITTGISYKIFTLDKSLESELSAFVLHLLKPYKITCQVLD